MQQVQPKPTIGPAYKFNHSMLPYYLERKLPINVINNIYSYLRPRREQTQFHYNLARKKLEYNHLLTTKYERLYKLKKEQEEEAKRREEIVTALTNIEGALKLLIRCG